MPGQGVRVVRDGSVSKEPGEVRRQRIVDLVRSEGYLRSSDISVSFGISEETARRDLATLDELGEIRRVRGGAVPLEEGADAEPSRVHREVSRTGAKREIAAIVRGLIHDGETVFVDVGTTVDMAARALAADFRGRVITTSLQVGMILAESTKIEVEMVGGRVRPQEFTVHGADALQALGNYSADAAIIGCGGLTSGKGITDFNPGDIPLKRTMIQHSRRSYVLADSTKLGKVAVRHICPLSAVDAVITDSTADPAVLAEIRASGVDVLLP